MIGYNKLINVTCSHVEKLLGYRGLCCEAVYKPCFWNSLGSSSPTVPLLHLLC